MQLQNEEQTKLSDGKFKREITEECEGLYIKYSKVINILSFTDTVSLLVF